MTDADDRQFMLTCAWIFARHGQTARARVLCEALNEDDPRDGIAAAALAELLLAEGNALEALKVVRAANFPVELSRASALLESRALTALGKTEEGSKRWKRFLASANGGARRWI